MLQTLVHYSFHFLAPGLIAYAYAPRQWKKYWLILIATMLVDADHLLADPIFQAGRCSIGFHPLHSYWMVLVYLLGSVFLRHKLIRIVFIGLLFHMVTDFIDCLWMDSNCQECELPGMFRELKSLL